jgi:GWxTD domain-containing protein
MKIGRAAVLIAIAALPCLAQTPPREFAKTPAKWLFTPEEQQAWKSVKTDDQAIDFIDLFWARRDPTPGTPRNENRLEFENRMRFADEHFREGSLRGALTERGRALVLLGFPANWAWESQRTSHQTGMDAGVLGNTGVAASGNTIDPTGGRELAAKDNWTYTHEQAVKFDVPKLEIVFLHDVGSDRVHRDPQRTDFTMALPGAIKSWITNPDLKTVPEWASSRTRREVVAPPVEEVTTTTVETKTSRIVVERPKPAARPAGAGKLTLVADPAALQPQSGVDPLANASSLSRFRKSQDLGWAAEYCAGSILDAPPPVKVQVKVAGSGGSISSEPEEFVPDSIRSEPGCYLLRGSVPLADVDAGPQTLTITLTAGQQGYNLTRQFAVE